MSQPGNAVRSSYRRPHRAIGLLAVAGLVTALLAVPSTVSVAAGLSTAANTTGTPYPCGTSTDTEYAQGTTAAAIGWAGNDQAVVACLGGSFVVKNTGQTYGYGIYDGSRTSWVNAEGHLPALVTSFHRAGATISITDLGDKISIGGHAFVAIYSRVSVTNPTSRPITLDPQASANLVALNSAPIVVAPHRTVRHDYATVSDRFAGSYPYPAAGQLRAAGGYDQHYQHMRSFWNGQLKDLAQIRQLPDPSLIQAYQTGFIYTQITRGGVDLKTGVNGYDKEYSHDVIGILANMLNQGFRTDGTTTALDLLLHSRDVVGTQAQYDDGIWKYSWPWAIYLQKTGDLASVKANFSTPGPNGSALQPSISDSAHAIAAARTGPGGIIKNTPDIDSDGFWTIDDYSALMGLASYRWLAQQVGDSAEYTWANNEYSSLLGAVNQTLTATITQYHLNYLPCSMLEPNDNNRCSNPKDANWGAPFLFGRWAWDGYLFGAPINGPGYDLIDATYNYGFGRLQGILPPNTLGGYGDTDYTTGYNAGYGEWGLASNAHRDQGILNYQFMIANAQAGPYSWWESVAAPATNSPWIGNHPSAGAGASPHAWGSADANLVLLDSLVAERADGSLIVGRGVPDSWIRTGKAIEVANLPITGGKHLGVRITTHGKRVTLTLTGHAPAGPVLFQLPIFVNNLARASAGAIDPATGTVTLSAHTHTVTVQLRH
ncbi:MAG: hypothetical protein ACR2N4_09265 [Jatrophihabitans sp.]